MKTTKAILFLAAVMAAGCAKPEIPSHYFEDEKDEVTSETGNGDYTRYTEINGTDIDPECNAVGWVYDPQTGTAVRPRSVPTGSR